MVDYREPWRELPGGKYVSSRLSRSNRLWVTNSLNKTGCVTSNSWRAEFFPDDEMCEFPKVFFSPLCATTSTPSKPNTFALVIGRLQLLILDSTGLMASIAVICFKHVSSSVVANTIYFHCYGTIYFHCLDCFVYSFTIHYAKFNYFAAWLVYYISSKLSLQNSVI